MSSPEANGGGGALRQALQASDDRPAPAKAAPEVEYFCLRIRQMKFAVESGFVHEVVRLPPLTRLPAAPPFVLGVGAHRGEVLPVIDLARLMAYGDTAITGRTRAAIARAEGMVVAMIADQLEGLTLFKASSVAPAPVGGEGAAEYLSAVVTTPQGAISVLDLSRILGAARARTVTK